MVRDAFETAQQTLHSRVGGAREQAQETLDNLESLFQSRVQRAMHQLGVPTAEEIRVAHQARRRTERQRRADQRAQVGEEDGRASGAAAQSGAVPQGNAGNTRGRDDPTQRLQARRSSHARPATSDRATRTSHRRFGLALAGGGPLGAFYEVGCLHAIEEAFDGYELTELEMYVGVSSGRDDRRRTRERIRHD